MNAIEGKNILSANQILAAEDYVQRVVSVPEWGGHVIIKGLSGNERDKFETELSDGGKVSTIGLRAKLVAACAVDSTGQTIFTADQVDALGKKAAAPLDRCFTVARELNGFTDADIDELEGNSDADQSAGSTSG